MKLSLLKNCRMALVLLASLFACAIISACGNESTSSDAGQCQTFTDANGNPVTQCSQG